MSATALTEMKEFNCSKIVQEMNTSFENDVLHMYFSLHCREYAAEVSRAQIESERNLDSALIKPLEIFLTKSQDPNKEFERLKRTDPPLVMCGKLLEPREAFYRCSDCSVDPSSLFCSDCFQNSVHRVHNHQIEKSSDGGFCNCGDEESWRSGHSCNLHKHEQSNDPSRNIQENLPSDMKIRAARLFEAVMLYAHKALTSSFAENLSNVNEKLSDGKDHFCTMLLNDVCFSSEQALNILLNVWSNFSMEEAKVCVEKLERDGRVCIQKGEKNDCEIMESLLFQCSGYLLEEESSKTESIELHVEVIKTEVVAQQEVACKLLQWLRKIINISDGLKSVYYRILVKPNTCDGSFCFLERFMVDDSKLWKAPRLLCNQLYWDVITRKKERKAEVACMLTRLYPSLVAGCYCAKQGLNAENSLNLLVNQIYTGHYVVKLLVIEHKVIEVILKSILNESEAWKVNGILKFQGIQDFNQYRRLLKSFYHLRAILRWSLICFEWTDDMKHTVLEGFELFLNFLSLIQEMDISKVPIKEDLVANWDYPWVVQMYVEEAIKFFIELCSSDEEVLKCSYNMILTYLLHSRCERDIHVIVKGHTAECCHFDVRGHGNQTNIFLPLHRLLAALFIKLPDNISHTSDCFAPLNQVIQVTDILEYPLRVLVFLSQVESRMWDSRGDYPVKQMLNYKQWTLCQETYDKDILLLQVVASLMDPNEFIIHLLNKFNLLSVFDCSSQKSPDHPEDKIEDIIDNFFWLLIIILGERYVEGVGEVDRDTILKRELVHRLAASPMIHTEVVQVIPSQMKSKLDFEENLKAVAYFWNNLMDQTLCTLRPEYYDWFNPCFHHYNIQERAKAEQAQQRFRQEKGLSSALPIPKPPKFCNKFLTVSSLLKCDVMLHMWVSVILDIVHKKAKVFSESNLEKVLHLITLGFHEDKLLFETGDISLPFTLMLQEAKAGDAQMTIIELLQQLSTGQAIGKPSTKDLCEYVLESYRNVLSLKNNCVIQ